MIDPLREGVRLAAPAKLNLFLHIVGRRSDGYHLLQTAFRLIDLCDRITIAPCDDGAIRLETELPGVPAERNLVLRAAHALKSASGARTGAVIRLEKRIPMGAGLGGGSSDAATTLIGLARIWRTGHSADALARIAVTLGADVPFFLFGRNAFGEGIGEALTALDLAPAWYVVLTPQVVVSTAEIFAAPELTRDAKPIKITAFFNGFGRNDLEPAVCARYPEVAKHLAWLRGFGDARMSGSGSSVFAEFASEAEARAVVARIPEGMRGFAVRGLDRHPLAVW
jgi:4-diphosphocytidyl-2-C-methyl-D-erythritol kinase